jgi:hypothetical protein
LAGTLIAGLMGLAAATVVPATNVVPPPKDLPAERNLLQMGYILLCAWVTALVFAVLSRKK